MTNNSSISFSFCKELSEQNTPKMIILAFCVILSGYYVYHLWDMYYYWKKRGVVGPTPWPVVGNYGSVLFGFKTEGQLIQEIYQNYPQEKYVGIFVGTTPLLVLRDLEMVKKVFGTDYKNFPDRSVGVAFSQYHKSLFVSPGNEQWQEKRKSFISLSKNTRMREVLGMIQFNFLDYVDKLTARNPNQNVCKLYEKFFFLVSSDAVMGEKWYDSFDEETKLQTRARMVVKLESWELLHCLDLIFPRVFKSLKLVVQKIAKILFSYVLDMIHSAIIYRKPSNREIRTFADIILELQEENNIKSESNLDDESIILHLATTVLGLTVTASNTVALMSFELAKNPEIQKKCYDEIHKVLQNFGGQLTFESLSEMKYLDMIIDETGRKYGNNASLNRICGSKYCFPGTDLLVDPGVLIVAPAESFRKDPKYFSDPDKFIPERFAPKNKDRIPAGANLQFGYGPRQCIGKPLAKLIMKMLMAAFLHKFQVEPSTDTPEELKFDRRFRLRVLADDKLCLNIFSRK